MKKLMLFISAILATGCMVSKCNAQKKEIVTASSNGIVVTDEVRLNQLGLDRKIDLSKGEQFTEQEWQQYLKTMAPYVKEFFKRDSAHQKFVINTITPHLMKGDTIVNGSLKFEGDKATWKVKPKK